MARKKTKAKAKRPAAKKAKRVAAIPKGFHTLTPYMTIERCNDALQFYQKAFGAKLLYALNEPGGRIAHAELRVGDSVFMVADAYLSGVPPARSLAISCLSASIFRSRTSTLSSRAR